MEEPINHSRIPETDSIRQLAEFWDTHDLADFEDELEEVTEAVFQSGAALQVHLTADETKRVQRIAQASGVGCGELLRQWVLEKIGMDDTRGRVGS